MVQSILDKTINYKETNKLAKEDENFPTIAYEISLEGKERTLALGQPKYDYSNKNIIYFPIYLIVNDEVNSRVGIYEIFTDQLSKKDIFDEDGDIDVNKLNKPLYFSYFFELLKNIDETFMLQKESLNSQINELLEVSKPDEPDEPDKPDEPEKSEEVNESVKYNASQSTFWIQKAMKDNNYRIQDNEGGGECLFAAIRDAYKTIDQERSVAQLRELVSNKATQDIFDNYRSLYESTFGPIDKLKDQKKQILKENKEIIAKHKQSKNKSEQKQIEKRNKELIELSKNLNTQIKELEDDLLEVDYLRDLKNVTTLEKFKEYIKSCNCWGESWAISILENFLKIKLILLDRTKYDPRKQFNEDILFCGDQIHPDILMAKSFKPDVYIILDYNGSHFQLITYKKRGVFTFNELPTKIKLLLKKCTLTQVGSYHLIEDLINYKVKVSGGKTKRYRGLKNKQTRKFK